MDKISEIKAYRKCRKFRGVTNFGCHNSWPTVYSAILVLVSIIMQNVVLTADRIEFLCRQVCSFALHEILTSIDHQVSEYNQVLLAISVSVFPVDGTFTIKIVPFYFITCNEKSARLSRKPRNLTSEQQLKNRESFTP